ncbi:MAG: mandelate racemase/muconate lactonizing enzyme family protein [Actinocatenispora sp.]
MRITALETVRPTVQPNLVFVLLHTDEGVSGLGEAFFAAGAVEAYLHDEVAPALLGTADPRPEPVARLLSPYVGFQGGGVETRAVGAVDLAVWDLLGKQSGLPVVDLLGGAVRDRVRIYNTCAGSGYVRGTSRQESANWGVGSADRYEDLDAFLHRPGELARELRDEGIGAMKVWPFDTGAERTGGTDIRPDDLARGTAVLAAIRDTVGDDLDVMVELHGLWNRRAATTICDAVAPYRPYWVEDPLRPDAVDALAALARDIDVPVATGETCVGRRGFAGLLSRGAVDVVTVDVQWTGGLTEARKVASLADTYATPVAPHDCTGPVSLAACLHLVSASPNGLLQETVRAFLRTWYAEVVTGLPSVVDGHIAPTGAAGHGVALSERLDDVRHATRRMSTMEDQ